MVLFIKKIIKFFIIFSFILLFPFILPSSKNISENMIFAKIDKDNLLKKSINNRLILVGGSNVSFGINSNLLKSETNYIPINTAIHANIGLYNMLNNIEIFLRPGDILIVIPEYEQFYDNYFFGGDEYYITQFEVDKFNFKKFNYKQIIPFLKFFPKYNLQKYNLFSISKNKVQEKFYMRNSFNEFGDEIMHYGLKNIKYEKTFSFGKNINTYAFKYCAEYTTNMKKRGVTVYFNYPSLDRSTSISCKKQILEVVQGYEISNIKNIGNYKKYIFEDSMFFNTRYHLNKNGVINRTKLLILDLKNL